MKERDQNQPMVYPQVRHEVKSENFHEPALHGPANERREPNENTEIGEEDLAVLVWRKEWRLGHKVIRPRRVRPLSRDVHEKIKRPSKHLHRTINR